MIQTHVHESSSGTVQRCLLKVCIFQHNGACLPSKLHENRLQMLACRCRNDTADFRAACKVDLPHMRVCYKFLGNDGGIRWRMEDEVEATIGQPSLSKDVGDGPVAHGREFGSLEDCSVSGCKGKQN